MGVGRRNVLPLLLLTLALTPSRSAQFVGRRERRQADGGDVLICSTAGDLPGICTTLRACPSMDRLLGLIKRGQATAAQAALLRRETLKCPFMDAFDTPRVCCADSLEEPAPPTAPPTPRQNTAPPVTAPPTPRQNTAPPVTPVTPVVTPPPAPRQNTASPVTSVTPAVTPLRSVGLPSELTCGVRSFLSRVFGGQAAKIGSWPWLASIGYRVTDITEIQWRCAATLITSHHLLTAAHCVSDLPSDTKPMMVRLGELDFTRDPDCVKDNPTECADSYRDLPIGSLHPHHLYGGRFKNAFEHDIAVVRLARTAEPFSDFVNPICLPLDLSRLAGGSDSEAGSRVFVAGWGRSEEFSFDDFTPTLQEAAIRLVPRSKCEASYNKSLTAGLGSRLCAGEGAGVDTCRGDSGGPMIIPGPTGVNWYLIGVTSFGSIQCGVRAAVYTRVHDYLDWIKGNLL